VYLLYSYFYIRELFEQNLFLKCPVMQGASASGTFDRGEANSAPPLPSHPINLIPRSNNLISDKPVTLSFPVHQFENFEQFLNETDNPNTLITKDSVINNQIASSVSPSEINVLSRTRLNPPVLINSSVQNFVEPMEIKKSAETANRKRALPLSSSTHSNTQGENATKKMHPAVSKVPRDSSSISDKENILYSTSDSPPFYVHVHSQSENSLNLTHPLLISRTLSRLAYSNIKEIKKLGRGKVLVEMDTAKSANNLVLNPKLSEENLKAFVPVYRTVRSGIIKDIPQHYDESDLLEFLDSPFKVMEVKRLNRRTRIDDETKYIPSRTVCLKFSGQILPKYVYLCRNRFEVSPFIPKVKICFSCYRVGHISKACKGKPRCIFCGKDMAIRTPARRKIILSNISIAMVNTLLLRTTV